VALTGAEKQRRYIQRLKAAAAASPEVAAHRLQLLKGIVGSGAV
jgi:hypothetical protein